LSSSIPSEGPGHPLSTEAFRRACGRFATGVAIVTTMDGDGNPHGLTINSFSSVSLDPPLVLFCLDRASQTRTAFETSISFVVNILYKSQRDLSHRFATRQDERFTGLRYREGTLGAPVLTDCLANLECRRHAIIDGGDHIILIGEVVQVSTREGEPLLYFAGRYRQLGK
jgi:flavin reductase (DIM6/NTAB) family NADH-FMN oxidoreductase RutF